MLSDKRILEEMSRGNIVIEPFDMRQLGTNSYDCRLGEWYFVQGTDYFDVMHEYTLFSESLRAGWGKPRKAHTPTHDEVLAIPVEPGQTILAHTMETIGGRNGYLAVMKTRSTVARSGIDVCKAAGLGDVGYIARWTLEISNHTFNTVWLPVGARIGQIYFEEVGETIKQYSGNYGQEKEWTPDEMLPNAKPDWSVEEYQQALLVMRGKE